MRKFPYDVSGPQFIGPIVVRGEKLHDTDAVAVCQKGRDSAAQHFPVGFFRRCGIRQNAAVYKHDVVERAESIAAPCIHEDFPGYAQENDFSLSSQIFNAGVGGQCRRQSRLSAFFQQILRELPQDFPDTDFQILVCGQCFGFRQHTAAFKVIYDGIRAGSAGVNSDSLHFRSLYSPVLHRSRTSHLPASLSIRCLLP